ncbi:ATP synthase subunit g, mitochondrial-like [Vanessa cardui]|uniref:ATP synthase subunit g, mitochondrial-like n=1 Tax=Vanessa cardui TaxID=171605 RepID=UPI001F139957|nr:ATP synthase subunit g, mitochondrial-like [Vanessa cardui]
MSIGTNAAKNTNILFRFKSILLSELSSINLPTFRQRNIELKEFLKEKSSKALQSEWGRKISVAKGFYQLELSLPKSAEMKQLQVDFALAKEFIKSGCYKFITVKQAWLLFLVSLEVMLWFFLGETIGKMHIVGYKV